MKINKKLLFQCYKVQILSYYKNRKLIYLIDQIKMSSPTHPTRIRKSLCALKGSDQRKSYFYCLKLFAVLPVPPGSDFNSWIYPSFPSNSTKANDWTNQKKYLKPKVIQDIFVASHSTACEHRSDFFSFYHRHLNILIQIFLNFIHQILADGFSRLGQIYPPSQEFKNVDPFKSIKNFKYSKNIDYDFLYKGGNIEKWSDVFNTYKKLVIPKQIANHYWQATNYLNDQDLKMVQQLAPNDKNDPIDILFYGINEYYPWEVNVEARWFNKQSDFDSTTLPFVQNIYSDYPNEDQTQLLAGNLDPRKNPNLYRGSFFREFTMRSKIKTRTHHAYNPTTKIFKLTSLEQKQSIASFGGKSKNLQYINADQKVELQQRNMDTSWVANYNSRLPHYQYAQTLFGSLQTFIMGTDYKGIERPHDSIHDAFGLALGHPKYSVMSLLFYPFHSWIDAMVQIKLRRANNPRNKKDYDFLYKLIVQKKGKQPSSLRANYQNQYNVIASKYASMSKWYLSGKDQIGKDVAGRYPIMEWIDQTGTSLSPSFCSRDYIFTSTKIRTSLLFNQIYRYPQYVQMHKQRYAFYKNLNEFNYNYNYQIGSTSSQLNVLLDQYAYNIPQYLKQMEAHIRILTAPQTTRKQGKVGSNKSQPQMAQQQIEQIDEQLAQWNLVQRKVLKQGIQLFALYPSNIQNGSNPIYLKLTNILKDYTPESITKYPYLKQGDLNFIETFISEGLIVNDIFIFGKEGSASECHKCKDHKGKYFDLDDDVRMRIPRLWKHLHLSSLNQTFYDSKHPQIKLKSLYDKLTLVPNPKFLDYRLVEGAEEIQVNVESSILTKEAKFIRLDAESYSIRTNTIKIVPSKKHSTFNTSFNFFKLHDLDCDNERNYFDRYVYKQLRGWVSVGSERVKFAVEIPSFQRILRLTLKITRTDKLEVVLVDKDYEAKTAYYQSYHK